MIENPTPYAVQYLNPSTGSSDYIDLKTGQPIPPDQLSYYQPTTQEAIDTGKTKLPPGDQHAYQEIFQRTSGGDHAAGTPGSTAGPRSMSNDYGYASKPGFLGVAAAVAPGPAGLVAKGASLAMNVNNRQAVQDARGALGMEHKANLGSIISDNKGYVGDITNGTESTPVGFEAQNSKGQTMMTPNEARMRQMVNPGTVSESDSKTVAAQAKDFKAANPDAQKNMPAHGLLGIGAQLARNMFHDETQAAVAAATPAHVHVQQALGLPTGVDPVGEVAAAAPQNRGLMDLSPSFAKSVDEGTAVGQQNDVANSGTLDATGGVSYSHPERGDVNDHLTQRTAETIGATAGQTPGGIHVSSAYRSPAVNDAIGGAATSYHTTGQAFDMSTKGLNNEQKSSLVQHAIMAGADEIGTYNDQSLHVATDRRNPVNMGGVAAMYNRSEYNMDHAPGWFTQGLTQTTGVPTPTARPQVDPSAMSMANPQGGLLGNPNGTTGGIAPQNGFAQSAQSSSMSAPSGPSQTNSGPSTSSGPSQSSASSSTGGMGMGGRSDSSTGSTGGGGFASAPGNSSASSKNDKSDSGSNGYGGSRSDGWN